MPGHGATGGTPTGNAITQSQADAAAAAAAAQVTQTITNIGSLSQGSDCLWPPAATFGVGSGGLLSFSFGVPCLITKSQARAVAAVGIIAAGLLIAQLGVTLLVGAEVLDIGLRVVGLGKGGKAAKGGKGGGAAPAAEPAAAPATSEVALAA